MGDGTNNPAVGIGYLVLAASIDTILPNIEFFARINTNGRWLIINSDVVSSVQVYAILWQAWRLHNMINVVILHTNSGFYINPFAEGRKEYTFDTTGFTNFQHFNSRTRNLNGYPLNIEAVSVHGKHFLDPAFHVFDSILAYFIQFLNATAHETQHVVDIEFRSVDGGGRFVGPMKLINESRIEISTNDRFLANYGKSNVAFLYPLKAVELFYLVPKQPTVAPSVFFLIFDGAARYLELGFLVVAGLVWAICEARDRWDFAKSLLTLVGVLFGVSVSNPNRDQIALRLLMAVCLLHVLIINSTFQGHITRELSTPTRSADIQTIKELLATNYSLHNSLPASTLYTGGDNSSDLAQLAQRSVLITSQEEMRELFRYKTHVAVLLKDFCAALVLTHNFDKATGMDRSHKIPEAPVEMLSAYIMRKDSAFLDRIAEAELRAVENGFVTIAIRRIFFHIDLLRLRRYRSGSLIHKTELHQITMENIEGLVQTCVLLYGVAVLLFVLEIVWYNVKRIVQ